MDRGSRYGHRGGARAVAPTYPAWNLLAGSTVASALSLLALAVPTNAAEIAGYVAALSGLLLLIAFRFVNRARQMKAGYRAHPWVARLALLSIVGAMTGLVLGALRIAERVPG